VFLFWANFRIFSNLKIMILSHTKDFSGKKKDDDEMSYGLVFENAPLDEHHRSQSLMLRSSFTNGQDVSPYIASFSCCEQGIVVMSFV
jgi:hypothetical protein